MPSKLAFRPRPPSAKLSFHDQTESPWRIKEMSGACLGEIDTGVQEAASAPNPQSTRVSHM